MGNTATMHNGVNVEELGALVSRVQANPALGKFQFRSKARWINRAHSQSTFDSLYGVGVNHKRATPLFQECDEPAALLGTDLAPNAGEAVLHALGREPNRRDLRLHRRSHGHRHLQPQLRA